MERFACAFRVRVARRVAEFARRTYQIGLAGLHGGSADGLNETHERKHTNETWLNSE